MKGKDQIKQLHIFKINSAAIRDANWELNVNHHDYRNSEGIEVVSLADSQVLRFVRQIRKEKWKTDLEVNASIQAIKAAIKEEISKPNSKKSRAVINKLYEDLRDATFIDDYIFIVMDKLTDFTRLNRKKKSFTLNDRKFKRLFATSGGGKKKTVVYVKEDIHDELNVKINNDRNMNVKHNPAKLEAYKSLTASASIPLPAPKGVIVVKDAETEFYEKVIRIYDDPNTKKPIVINDDNYKITNNASDGFGLMLPSLNTRWSEYLELGYESSGLGLRNAFLKGIVVPFDYVQFAEKEAEGNYFIEDAWGQMKDVREAELIVTTSMLKLYKSYASIEAYLEACEKHGYTFSATKATPEKLENQRSLNYQFIEAIEMSDEDLNELISPTVSMIKNVLSGDYRKSLIYLKGSKLDNSNVMTGEYDFAKALMIDKNMINDPFVKKSIKSMLSKRMDEAKKGDLIVEGNFAIACGDPFTLCQSMFKLSVTGLLKKGEFYSRHWSDKGVTKVACFRAPMSLANNIRILEFKDTEKMSYWYKYIKTVNIFNSFDSTPQAQNGEDFDGDANLTTPNDVLLRNIKILPAIICEQKPSQDPIVPDEKDFIQANKLSFGDEIGSITNRGTRLYDVKATVKDKYGEDSKEYQEVCRRIACIQHYQQNAIDKTKGIEFQKMDNSWYSRKANDILPNDSEGVIEEKQFNMKLLADKVPYFFIYNYPHEMSKYKKYLKDSENHCIFNFGATLSEMLNKIDRSIEEETFVNNYYEYMPVSLANSVMNRLCKKVEMAFLEIRDKVGKEKFDYSMLKTDREYSLHHYNAVYRLYETHNKMMQIYMRNAKEEGIEDEEVSDQRKLFTEYFKRQAYGICNNTEELTNIVLDICYGKRNKDKSKQFAWDVCGEQIIANLLHKNNYTIEYPQLDPLGDIEFGGERFKMKTKRVRGVGDIE